MDLNLENEPTAPPSLDPRHERLARLAGDWRGTARTWFDPTSPAIEAAWEGRIATVLGGRFARFDYRSSIQDKPIAGELLIAYEAGEKLWRTTWIDSFHTGTAILVSVGTPEAMDLDVRGTYFAAAGHPHWGWRTVVENGADDALVIRMFNVSPEGREDLGVEIVLHRA